jgi:tetratricopeptide (TPR) repeat protein
VKAGGDSRPLLDRFGRYGELRAPLLLWVVIALLTRHSWIALAAVISARRVPEAAILLIGFSWWPVVFELPAFAVAVTALVRSPDAGRLARLLWRNGRLLLAITALAQIVFVARRWLGVGFFDDLRSLVDAALVAANVAALAWLVGSAYLRQLFADFPPPNAGKTVTAAADAASTPAGEPAPPDPAGLRPVNAAGEAGPAPRLGRRPPEAVAQLDRVMALYRESRFAEAEAICRSVIASEPRDPDALHLLGVMRLAQGDARGGIDFIGRAIALVPDFADYHANIAVAYRRAGRTVEADRHARRAAQLRGETPETPSKPAAASG